MQQVVVSISMSLDGYITDPAEPLEDPGRLHDWMFDRRTDADAAIRDEIYATTGSVVLGKRMFDLGFEPWGDPPPFGMPVFVLTHERRDPLPMQGGTTYTFANDGIEATLEQARAAAGEKNVGIWGGADVIDQYVKSGLLDEIQLHLVPMLLGEGIRLFDRLGRDRIELERVRTIETPAATHLWLRVVR
jgi:dihydrofolate reductase